jgi:hypothetical protein
MKLNLLSIAVIAGLTMSSCNSAKNTKENAAVNSIESEHGVSVTEKLPYQLAKNYFVKNTYKNDQIETLKITTQDKFDEVFGMAATMAESGRPTKIDFLKQYVIAVIGVVTNKETEFIVNDLRKVNNEILFNYSLSEGKEMSFTIQPSLIITVDNNYNGELKVEKK